MLRRRRVVTWALVASSLAWPNAAASLPDTPAPTDGQVVADEACAALPEHARLDDFGRWYFDAPSWERARSRAVACRHVRYASGGHAVEGFVLRPTDAPTGTRLPAILYARGGSGDFGRINALVLAELRLLAAEGFVVAATDYRFVGPLARRDEWGGIEVDDVLNLVPLLQSRPEVDSANLFMLGVSRGGTMTYLALKRGVAVNAAAVIAAPSDMAQLAMDRPEFVLGGDDYDGWARIWPGFVKRGREHLEARSAVSWADRLDKPLLILHARDDNKVSVRHALALGQALQAVGAEYELVIYGHDGHSLPRHREDRNRRIVEWFRAHMRRDAPGSASGLSSR